MSRRSIFLRILFFVLTTVAIVALYLLWENGIVIAVVTIGLAEYLMRFRGWRNTGVESALWIGGLFSLVADLPGEPRAEAMLLFAAASAISGWRVRNPFFGALAAILVMSYVEEKFDWGVVFALACGVVALLALCRKWEQETTEWLWIAIAMALPMAGWYAVDAKWRTMTIALYAIFGVLALTLAIVKRHHAMFFASMIGFTVAATELARTLSAPLEAKLAVAGAFLLALSFVVSRALRDRTTGFVVTKQSLTEADDLIELAGTVAIGSPQGQSSPETREPGGGQFGGAGASGSY